MKFDQIHKLSGVFTSLLLMAGSLAVLWCYAPRLAIQQGAGASLLQIKGEFPQTSTFPFAPRVNAEIAAVAARSEEELLPALDLGWVVGSPGIHTGGIPMLDLDYALADRNLRKLDEILTGYDAGKRCQRIEQLNKSAFDGLAAVCEDDISALDRPQASVNVEDIPKQSSRTGKKIAVCGTLLLAAKHCGVATLTRMLQSSIDFAEAIPVRLEGKPHATEWHRTEMAHWYRPDEKFQLNVLLYAARSDSTLSARLQKDLNALIDRAVDADAIHIHEIEVCRWDAMPNWFEMEFLKGNQNILDRRRGTEKISVCSWRSHSETTKDELISSVRRVLQSDHR